MMVVTVTPIDEYQEYLIYLKTILRHTGYALECMGALKDLPELQRSREAKKLVLNFIKNAVIELSLNGTLADDDKFWNGVKSFDNVIYEVQKEVEKEHD